MVITSRSIRAVSTIGRRSSTCTADRSRPVTGRLLSTFTGTAQQQQQKSSTMMMMFGVAAGTGVITFSAFNDNNNTNKTYLSAAKLPSSGDVISSGTPVKEVATGILFPQLCNGYYLAGCGVRVKYGFVKVYAVGTYVDPLAVSAVKKSGPAAIEQALLDPTYPRTIRIVMNRSLTIEKYTSAIVESLKPRMMGQDLDKLEEFKSLNPPVDLVEGAEIEMTIRGDTLLYKNAVGGVGTIRSEVFTKALCDTYYGKDPVSPTHKAAVLDGISKL